MAASPVARILVVDDEPAILLALRRTLSRAGYEVLTTGDPSEALELLAAGSVDIVLSDQVMPRMTGFELLREVRARFPAPVRLMLTGHVDEGTAAAALAEGLLFRFLTKPWEDAELKGALQDACAHLAERRQAPSG